MPIYLDVSESPLPFKVPVVEPFDIDPPVPDVVVCEPLVALVALLGDLTTPAVPVVVVIGVPLLLGDASLDGTPVVEVLFEFAAEVWAKAAAGRMRDTTRAAAISLFDTSILLEAT